MTNKFSSDNQDSPTPAGVLSVNDLERYLVRLAGLHADPETGNLKLSEGLREIAKAMRPYRRLPITELARSLGKGKGGAPCDSQPARRKVALPPDLRNLSWDQVRNVLDDDRYVKAQLAELGFSRFGLSRSRLERLGRREVLETLYAALDREVSLDIIARSAEEAGARRSS